MADSSSDYKREMNSVAAKKAVAMQRGNEQRVRELDEEIYKIRLEHNKLDLKSKKTRMILIS